jgi:hypothetical protein
MPAKTAEKYGIPLFSGNLIFGVAPKAAPPSDWLPIALDS